MANTPNTFEFEYNSAEHEADAKAIATAIAAYRAKYECGEQGCETCSIAVAIGLEHLDAAYNAGAAKRTAE